MFLTQDLDKFMNKVFNNHGVAGEYYYDSQSKTLQIPVPGLDKDNLSIKVVDRIIKISSTDSTNSPWVKNLNFDFVIPDRFDNSNINAKVTNGVLVISFKENQSPVKSIQID